MYYLPTSCLAFFFLFSLFHTLPCSSSTIESCDKTLFHCGNITAAFPFWGGNYHKHCGHPLLWLRCNMNTTTSIFISDEEFSVLQINQTSNTLKLARTDHLGSFCSSTFVNTTLRPEIYELSPAYKRVTVYHCNSWSHTIPDCICPGKGLILMSQNPEHGITCRESFTVNLPTSFVTEEKVFSLIQLEGALREGFEVMLKIDKDMCEECWSSHRRCEFNESLPLEVKCVTLHPQTATVLHTRCSGSFSCGDQKELFYPFWNSQRENCGHPDFKLECNSGFAEVSISSIKYRIIESNYATRAVRLARPDYMSDYCPQNPINATFNENILPFAPDTDMLTIYYDCGQDFSDNVSAFVGDLDCENDDRRNYYVTRKLSSPLLQGISGLLVNFRGLCGRTVSIPASRSALGTLELSPSTDNVKKVLQESFVLRANQECSRCISSDGACGYNQASSRFVCYCIDEQRDLTCGSGSRKKGLSKGVIAGIVVGSVAVVAILLGIVGLFCLISRRKKMQAGQYTSKDLPVSSYSSRETSRNPTSTTISSSSNHSLLPSISNVYDGVQVFSYEELEEATNNFSRELGDGGFGTVYYGVLKDGRAVAVKRLYERSLKRVEQFKNEIEILKSLKHPNLVILYGCTSRHSRELLLVYEYISNGTLADHLHGDRAESRPLCWPVRLNVAIETAKALTFLHASEVIHRDVKTTNILLDENYTVKVADFGLSRLFRIDQTHISTAPQGTPGYVDPEYYQCYRLNEKSDVYSFGVVLTELISSKEAVDITRHRHDINLANMAVSKIQSNAIHELVDPSLGFEKDPEVRRNMMSVAELAFRCLQQEREVRPSMDEIVKILRGIKGKIGESSPDVVDIEGSSGDDVGLLRHSVPPPISPETDKGTSGSDTAASSF